MALADTRMPRPRRRLPRAVIDAPGTADLIAHPGDFKDESLLHELAAIGSLPGVRGNTTRRWNTGSHMR
jgi:predicted phosphodiesterase